MLIDAAGLKPRHGPGYYARVYSYKAGKWVPFPAGRSPALFPVR